MFECDEPGFDLASGEVNPMAEPTRRELPEVNHRGLRGFERAATANTWLGADGLNAEASLFAEADRARYVG